jgi:hypothetical protein
MTDYDRQDFTEPIPMVEPKIDIERSGTASFYIVKTN